MMTIWLPDVSGEGLSRVRLRRPDGGRHGRRIRLASIRQLPRHLVYASNFRATMACAVRLAAIALISTSIIGRSAASTSNSRRYRHRHAN
jgi:hypothetical protein